MRLFDRQHGLWALTHEVIHIEMRCCAHCQRVVHMKLVQVIRLNNHYA